MLAGFRAPDPLGSAQRKSPTTGKDVKVHNKQRTQDLQAASRSSGIAGLEMMAELVWDEWDVGKDFTKTLVLKNIHKKPQRLHLRLPVTTFFTTMIQHKIVVSPGTTFFIPVTFRPFKKCEYEDSFEFHSKYGSSEVRLRAVMPCHVLEVPDSVLLPLCAVQHSSHTTFKLKNARKLQTHFQWDPPEAPFQLSPERGWLKPGEERLITVVFHPQKALVYQQDVYCRFGAEGDETDRCCSVLLQGLAKYPCLQIKNLSSNKEKERGDPVLNFGSVAVGQTLHKHFDIFNPSPVTASFSLSCSSSGVSSLGSEFSCDITRGEVAPGASVRARVSFTPGFVDTVSVEYLSLDYRAAPNETLVKLKGSCEGPKVSLSSSVVDFGCVEEGGAVMETVKMLNSSHAQAVFQWDLDCFGHSVFSVQPASGTVDPHSHSTLKVFYRPTQCRTHHRRVACLILHGDPVFLDVIGTCHSEFQKPDVLKPEHLVQHRLHRDTQRDPSITEESDHRQDTVSAVPFTPMEEYFQSSLGSMEPLSSTSSPVPPHISVDPRELLFNHKISSSSACSTSSCQYVTITNNTRGKLSLEWTSAQDSPFTVSPSLFDLAPLVSTAFRVTYSPKQLNTLHGAQLECFAYCKDDGHLKDHPSCLPWCVTVRVVGHSFETIKEHFIPHCSLEPRLVVFPSVGILSYRTVVLLNNGKHPLTFCLNLDHDSNNAATATMDVVPSCGLIQPGTHQILTLRTIPTEDSPKQGFNLHLQLNAAKYTQKLKVVRTVERPCVSLEGDGNLYFQPTNVGFVSQRSLRIRNLSCLPLRLQWRIPEPDKELISVEPDADELHPNESLVQTWSFSPPAEKTYTLKPTLAFWPTQTPECDKSQLTLNVVGMGSTGFLEAKHPVVDVGDILVGSYRSLEVPLVNNSPCAVSFCVSVQQMCLDKDHTYDPKTESSALQLDCESATIASRSAMLLQSTISPHRSAQYVWTISYQTLNASGLVSSPPKAICKIHAKGAFPTLQVIDACNGGSIRGFSKMYLWKLLSLDLLNEHLLSNHSLCSSSVFPEAIVDFNFSAAPLNSEPSTFALMLHNSGLLPVEWAFLFPRDQEIELEYWAESGEFSSTELHHMKVQDNHLFSITPRSGSLQPGQQRAVKFTYSHDFAGTNWLPVVFKLSCGREILLKFQGVTVEGDRPYFHGACKTHIFTAVAIGDCSPPRQVCELYNSGTVSLHYKVDTAVLNQLQEDNFNHPILQCLNPEGEILSGKTTMLEWIFSPLESRLYHVDIPIQIQDGESTLLSFEGCGFNPTSFDCSNKRPFTPCGKRVPFPGQMVFLSEDAVSLGDIAICSQFSRILFLTNVTYTDKVLYVWELPQQHLQVVHIEPDRGVLCPGETATCVLTFTSTENPTIYQLDLICQVTQEAALTQYHDALQRLEEDRERKLNEFTITEKKLQELRGSSAEKDPVAAPARKLTPFSKYKTLPPIRAKRGSDTTGRICLKLTKAERRAIRESAKVQKDPEPPQPDFLHLWVTAHSHALAEYLTYFPDEFKRHYRHIADDLAFAQYLKPLESKPITYQPCKNAHPACKSQKDASSATPQCLWHELNAELEEPQSTADDDDTSECFQIAGVVEDVLVQTLQNLMTEAVRGEFDLTASKY